MNTPNPSRQQPYPTPPGTGSSARGRPDEQPGQPRRYTTYQDVVSPQQQQPAPYQSNVRLRRRTQVELQMHHGAAWLGYSEVIPNVSVVTGGPLVAGPLPTHGTWGTRGHGGGGYPNSAVDNLADRVSRSLTIATNRKAAEEQERGVRHG